MFLNSRPPARRLCGNTAAGADRSEIDELHGAHGRLDGVTLKDGALLPVKFLFLFLGALPCTDWLGDTIERDANGFVLTGDAAGQWRILETSVPGERMTAVPG